MWDSIYKGIDDIIYDNIDNKMIENNNSMIIKMYGQIVRVRIINILSCERKKIISLYIIIYIIRYNIPVTS